MGVFLSIVFIGASIRTVSSGRISKVNAIGKCLLIKLIKLPVLLSGYELM